MLPQNEAIDYVFKSEVLLLLESSTSITTKVFEYLAAGKPIFAVIKKGELEKIIETHSNNSYIITSGSASEIENALVNIYQKWKLNNLKRTNELELKKYYQKYHRKYLTSELINIFNCFVSGK
jgi:glycosyltransferase involved in cell wall biosynthesis